MGRGKVRAHRKGSRGRKPLYAVGRKKARKPTLSIMVRPYNEKGEYERGIGRNLTVYLPCRVYRTDIDELMQALMAAAEEWLRWELGEEEH